MSALDLPLRAGQLLLRFRLRACAAVPPRHQSLLAATLWTSLPLHATLATVLALQRLALLHRGGRQYDRQRRLVCYAHVSRGTFENNRQHKTINIERMSALNINRDPSRGAACVDQIPMERVAWSADVRHDQVFAGFV